MTPLEAPGSARRLQAPRGPLRPLDPCHRKAPRGTDTDSDSDDDDDDDDGDDDDDEDDFDESNRTASSTRRQGRPSYLGKGNF